MKVIELSKTSEVNKGKYIAYVNDEDFDKVNQYSWHIQWGANTLYAYAHRRISKNKYRQISMHRLIMDFPIGKDVDHKNGFGLDNQRNNLRKCTKSQNHMNKRFLPKGSSKYRGVSWHSVGKKWKAQIRLNGKTRHIGLFHTEEEAFEAYEKEAKKLFGSYYTNYLG